MTDTTEAVLHESKILPFQIDASHMRGRIARLGDALDEILNLHQYPAAVAQLLGQTVALASTLSGALKYEGVFTLQAKGDGAITLLVADITSDGDMRGYAQFDEEKAKDIDVASKIKDLMGTGYLAFTVDQGQHMQRYQGIVELSGDDLGECVQHYFKQSEQIDTALKVACGRVINADTGAESWRAGAIFLQEVPEEGGIQAAPKGNQDEDSWRRAMILMSSATDQEMLDPSLPAEELLFRLFHEDGVRTYDAQSLQRNCRCSEERVLQVLKTLPSDDLTSLKKDGKIAVTCEFCSTEYGFTEKELLDYGVNIGSSKDA